LKVLVVLNQPPDPEGNAPGRCAVGLLRGLQAHGLDVQALAARREFAADASTPADLPVEIVPVPESDPGWRTRFGRLRRPRGEVLEGELAERVADAGRAADVIHLEETPTAWLDHGVDVPSLVHLHYLARRDRPFGAPWQRPFREVFEFDLAERAAIRRHRFLVASSPLVARELRRRAPKAEVVVAPLSVEPSGYRPAPLDGPPVAGLIGTAAWPPTRAAVVRLLERVWPLVRRAVPEARLVLAGRGMTELAQGFRTDGVEMAGVVPSAADFLDGLSLLLFPLTRGSGMKVKVLESIACGLPVVTTPAGAEGIEAGEAVVVAEEDGALAEAAASLLRDPDERRDRGRLAREAFLRLYAPQPATAPLVDMYRRMCEG